MLRGAAAGLALAVLLGGPALANAIGPGCAPPAGMEDGAKTLRRVIAAWDTCQVPAALERAAIQGTLEEFLAALDRLDALLGAANRERVERFGREEHYEFRRRIAFEPDLCDQPAMRPPGPGFLRQVEMWRDGMRQRLAPPGEWSTLRCWN